MEAQAICLHTHELAFIPPEKKVQFETWAPATAKDRTGALPFVTDSACPTRG
jgi:hypothetical protein